MLEDSSILVTATSYIEHTTMNTQINYAIASLASFSFLLAIIILLFYSKGDSQIVGASFSRGVIFFSGFVVLIAGLSINREHFYMIYILAANVTVGIALNIYGCFTFFKPPVNNERALGSVGEGSISVIMVGITVPLCLMDMVLAVVSVKHDVWQAAAVAVTVMQKLIQVGVYHFSIRHKVPAHNRHQGASWFLKIMALFNFAMYLHAIVEGSATMSHSMKPVLAAGASVVSAVYGSLVVDYRLLCLLLYIELALEVDVWKRSEEVNKNSETEEENIQQIQQQQVPIVTTRKFRIAASQYSGVGYLIGILVLLAQFTVAIQFMKNEQGFVGSCLFGILADLLVIIPGLVLLRMASSKEKACREPSAKGVGIMVASMGLVGLFYWILRLSITVLTATRTQHDCNVQTLVWISITNGVRIVGIVFQLVFFYRISPCIGEQPNIRQQKVSYLLIPVVMLAQISVFVNTVVDSYRHVVEEQLHHAHPSIVVLASFKMGEPLHLGFCLHMFFHFLVVNNNLRRKETTTAEHIDDARLATQDDDGDDEDGGSNVSDKDDDILRGCT